MFNLRLHMYFGVYSKEGVRKNLSPKCDNKTKFLVICLGGSTKKKRLTRQMFWNKRLSSEKCLPITLVHDDFNNRYPFPRFFFFNMLGLSKMLLHFIAIITLEIRYYCSHFTHEENNFYSTGWLSNNGYISLSF